MGMRAMITPENNAQLTAASIPHFRPAALASWWMTLHAKSGGCAQGTRTRARNAEPADAIGRRSGRVRAHMAERA
jgi:hypothetical protein